DAARAPDAERGGAAAVDTTPSDRGIIRAFPRPTHPERSSPPVIPAFVHKPINRVRELFSGAPTQPAGKVERLDPEGISGWVHRVGTADVEVVVNGTVVAKTFPSQPRIDNGAALDNGFSRTLKDLWKYLGQGDWIEVRYAGRPLPIEGHGDRWIC